MFALVICLTYKLRHINFFIFEGITMFGIAAGFETFGPHFLAISFSQFVFTRALNVLQLYEVPPITRCVYDVIKISSIVSVGDELETLVPLQTLQSNYGRHFHQVLVTPDFHTPRPVWLGASCVLLLCCASFFTRLTVSVSSPAGNVKCQH